MLLSSRSRRRCSVIHVLRPPLHLVCVYFLGTTRLQQWERFRSFCVYRFKRKMSAWRNPSQGAQWNSGGRLASFRSDTMKMLARSLLFVLAHAAFMGGAIAVSLLNSEPPAILTAALW